MKVEEIIKVINDLDAIAKETYAYNMQIGAINRKIKDAEERYSEYFREVDKILKLKNITYIMDGHRDNLNSLKILLGDKVLNSNEDFNNDLKDTITDDEIPF